MKLWKPSRCILATCLFACASLVSGFDGDISINNPNFKPENFLDLKAYEFSKSLDQQWYGSENGWRMTGGSVDIDRLFLDGQLKLKHQLSDKVDFRLNTEQRVFYAPKPVPHTMLEIDFHPWNPDISFSFLSNTAHDKRQVDIGGAIRVGQTPWHYLRLSWLDVDAFYNAKNSFDNSYYAKKPHTLRFEGALSYKQWQTRFHWEQYQPLKLVLPDESSTFQHRGSNYELSLEYHFGKHSWAGIALRSFEIKKQLEEIIENQKQKLSYSSVDIYWLQPWTSRQYELSTGIRFDIFDNKLRDITMPGDHFDYRFSTWQVYATLAHDYSAHAAWDFGVYIGDTYEDKDFLAGVAGDRTDRSIQGKLRTSWGYHSVDKQHTLKLHLTFNLDDLWNDPGDGAGMTYQGMF